MCKLYFNSLLRIADKCSIMGILQFPHSFTFEGIRVFQFLAMAGKATININLQVLCEHTFSFLLGTYLGERFLNCIVSVCLILQKKKKNSPTFFQSACTFCISTNNAYDFQLLHMLMKTWDCQFCFLFHF